MPSLTPWILAATFVGCKACAGCIDPGMPVDPTQPNHGDTDPPEDTADSIPPEDTAPPPPCQVPETEPNDDQDDADAVGLEQTACGSFSEVGDSEWLVFPGEDAQWIRVDVSAASIGSAADAYFGIKSLETFSVAYISNKTYEEDPWIVFPALGDEEYFVNLMESSGLYGEDYEWELLVSEDKAPVAWTVREEEDNDTAAEGQTVQPGDVILGSIDSTGDYDWFHIEVPDSVEKINWTFDVEGYTSGSPLASRITLWDETIVDEGLVEQGWLETNTASNGASDPDPRVEHSSQDAADWYLVIKNPTDDDDNGGSAFHWYTISIENDLE